MSAAALLWAQLRGLPAHRSSHPSSLLFNHAVVAQAGLAGARFTGHHPAPANPLHRPTLRRNGHRLWQYAFWTHSHFIHYSGRTKFIYEEKTSMYYKIGTQLIQLELPARACPLLEVEPAPRLEFANSTGGRLDCVARGSPQPQLKWLLADGAAAGAVPGLRQLAPNGSLLFPAFGAADFRPDIHNSQVFMKIEDTNLDNVLNCTDETHCVYIEELLIDL
ncbi:SFRICE_023204 [Gryllus bimaculatus]|nr:SFRICE_023204 [Gryllus bimaculatus]